MFYTIFQIGYKISANREKKQVYLHFSEVQPNFKQCAALIKVRINERNTKFTLIFLSADAV